MKYKKGYVFKIKDLKRTPSGLGGKKVKYIKETKDNKYEHLVELLEDWPESFGRTLRVGEEIIVYTNEIPDVIKYKWEDL